MNTKTKRRLSILLAAAVLAGGACGGFVIYRKQRTAHMYAQWRREGLAAYTANDYSTALDRLGRYVNRFPTDSEALYDCAQARLHLEESDHHEIPIAVSLLRRFVDLNPDRKDAREQLLDLYLKVGFFTETISTADQILATEPHNPHALRAKAFALFYLRRYNDALTVSTQYNDAAPVDLEGQDLTLTIMQRRGATSDDMVARADTLLGRHPDDSRFEFLKSAAYAMTGDRQSAVDWARKSAAHPTNDPAFLKILIRHLDSLGLFTEANGLQERAAKLNPDTQTRDNWVARLLESGQYANVIDIVDKEKNIDIDLLIYKTLALYHLDRLADAQAAQAVLADRGKTDAHAAAAADAIQKTLLHPDDAQAAISACNDALVADAQDPFFLFLLGKAYDQSGEQELADDHYQQAAIMAPAWVEPLVAKSKLLLSEGRVLDAFVAAQQARLRAPDNREALVAAATSGAYLIPANRTDEFKNLLALVQDIKTKYPDEQRVIPVQVMALTRVGQQADAMTLLKKTLDPQFPAKPETLLALANASQNAKLGQEEDCFSRYQQAFGITPQLAFARACWLFQTGHADDGLHFLDESRSKNAGKDMLWESNWATYLDLIKDPRAKEQWENLADKNPNDVKIQWLALAAKATQTDRPFIGRTIERLRNLRGDKGTFLSLTRAKYILQGDPSDKDTAEATLLLTEVNRQNPKIPLAHLLLATAYERQNNLNSAVDELTQAADLLPESNQISLSTARLLYKARDFARARPYIDRVTHSSAVSADDRRACAAFLAQASDIPAAGQQLELIPAAELNTNDKLNLASFYRQQNQTAKLTAMINDLLQRPTPEVIQLAADFYGSEKRDADAQHVLAMLDAIDCPAATKSRIRAGYLARFDKPENAIKEYLLATKSSPTDAISWRQLLSFCILTGRLDDIDRYANDAHAAIPSDNSFTTLNANLPIVHDLGKDPGFRPILVAIVQSPKDASEIAEALHLLTTIRSNLEAFQEPLTKLRQIATNSPNDLAVQIIAARACIISRRYDDATDLASRAMQAFPLSAEAAQVSAESLSAAGRWEETVTVGTQWRARLQSSPILADISVANAFMHLSRFDDAIRLLQPYVAASLKAPDENFEFVMLYAQALVGAGNTGAAEQLLKPLLPGQRWRSAWIELAVRLPQVKDSEAWLEYATEAFPSASPAERTQLALAYFALGRKVNAPRYEQSALAILEPLAEKPDCDQGTLAVLGSVYEAENNLAAAEMTYRRILKLDSKQPIILNNLAMVLVHRNSDLDEALTLIDQAIAIDPNVPNFFDTQATVLAQKKTYTEALNSIDKAIQIAPSDPEWQATRIWLLAISGKQESANVEFRQLQLSKNFSRLSDASRQRLTSSGIQ
jgi:Tfp pilus assembly protein PilF